MAPDDRGADEKGFTVNDNRWWLKDDVDLESMASDQGNLKPTYVEELEKRLASKQDQIKEIIEAHKSSLGDLEQIRQRLERELECRLEVEKANLAGPFVDVLENLERLVGACQNAPNADQLTQGAGLVVKQLSDRLTDLGIEPILAEDQAFDPNIMEAMLTTECEAQQEGMVLEVIRPGYKLGDRVVRPAGVRVGVAKRG